MAARTRRHVLVEEADIRTFLLEEYPRLVGAVTLACGSVPAAEDAVQEALVRAWERSERGEQIDRLDAWVATVALNLSRSAVRRQIAERRARTRLSAQRPSSGPDVGLDLHRALAALPRRQREAIVLRSFLELTVSEIAEAMGTAEGTVKSQLAKARAQLATALAVDEMPKGPSNPDTGRNHADA